jgi:hypothetical protein
MSLKFILNIFTLELLIDEETLFLKLIALLVIIFVYFAQKCIVGVKSYGKQLGFAYCSLYRG